MSGRLAVYSENHRAAYNTELLTGMYRAWSYKLSFIYCNSEGSRRSAPNPWVFPVVELDGDVETKENEILSPNFPESLGSTPH